MASTAYIICCNDAMIACILDNEKKAIEEKDRLARKDHLANHPHDLYDEYRDTYFWHIHEIDVE